MTASDERLLRVDGLLCPRPSHDQTGNRVIAALVPHLCLGWPVTIDTPNGKVVSLAAHEACQPFPSVAYRHFAAPVPDPRERPRAPCSIGCLLRCNSEPPARQPAEMVMPESSSRRTHSGGVERPFDEFPIDGDDHGPTPPGVAGEKAVVDAAQDPAVRLADEESIIPIDRDRRGGDLDRERQPAMKGIAARAAAHLRSVARRNRTHVRRTESDPRGGARLAPAGLTHPYGYIPA
jgi:hypothetical protein